MRARATAAAAEIQKIGRTPIPRQVLAGAAAAVGLAVDGTASRTPNQPCCCARLVQPKASRQATTARIRLFQKGLFPPLRARLDRQP